ncbi:MAG: hypothetical protein KME25_34225 [Symplocastrum torsivum CPER-KK1]|jgi:hypothetical protein|uniref:Uncharacterized protein n=1 Tax=Symplocastrum torsivum CPER-KK1 TaxID=450513 RepID=A0A951PTA8_9CYAN|nr:hypothetical protein [Symplocastrum torsivum CPER-KK1]
MDWSIRKAKLSIQSHVNFTIQKKLFYEEFKPDCQLIKKPKTISSPSVDASKALIDIAQRDVAGVLHLFDTSLEELSETEANDPRWINS